MILNRICQDCGLTFMGGPRAYYCQQCRKLRAKEARKAYKQRKSKGLSRTLGTVDICLVCGKEYEITGSNRKYCPECSPCVIRENDTEKGLEYYRENHEVINKKRLTIRRQAARVCIACGKSFSGRPHKKTCSEECALMCKRLRQRRADGKRSKQHSDD